MKSQDLKKKKKKVEVEDEQAWYPQLSTHLQDQLYLARAPKRWASCQTITYLCPQPFRHDRAYRSSNSKSRNVSPVDLE